MAPGVLAVDGVQVGSRKAEPIVGARLNPEDTSAMGFEPIKHDGKTGEAHCAATSVSFVI
jgi:hypothetical protein